MARYWESESPTIITTHKNVLSYYSESKKLSVARPPWTDNDGKEKPGKTVAFDVAALLESDTDVMKESRAVFADIVEKIDARLELL